MTSVSRLGVRQVEGGADRRSDADRIADRREFDQATAERQTARRGPRHLEGEAGLAHPSWPDQRDETVFGQQPGEVVHLVGPPDERA